MSTLTDSRARLAALRRLRDLREQAARLPWHPPGRSDPLPHQQPPDPPWDVWMLMGGRGSGKTEAGARYMARWMRQHPGERARIIAPTLDDAIESAVQGPSGILAMDPDVRWHPTAPGGARLLWPNGSEARVIGTPTPRDVERLRAGGNRGLDWWEELAANPQAEAAWDQAALGLRLGATPHSIATTTPRARRLIRRLLDRDGTAVTAATTDDNPHLPDRFRQELERTYAGTRLWRQEVLGELLTDTPGALWTPTLLDQTRVDDHPDLTEVVVAIDPSGGDQDGNDEQGIIVAGLGVDGHAYVLDDRSCRLAPHGWARRALQAFDDHEADRILWEANYGGDMVRSTLQRAAQDLGIDAPLRKVTVTRGKLLRAEPVAALYGDPQQPEAAQPQVHHLTSVDLRDLEDQMTGWTPESGTSPDRLDALVMAISDLMLNRRRNTEPVSWT